MTIAAIALSWALVLVLLMALLLGQPAALAGERAELHAAQTQVARPTPTLIRICVTYPRC